MRKVVFEIGDLARFYGILRGFIRDNFERNELKLRFGI